MIDIRKFCGAERHRSYLSQPYSIGDYTYATNGHVAIRVNRIVGVDENLEAPSSIAEILGGHDAREFGPLPVFDPPESKRIRCGGCHGLGKYNACTECEGSGKHMCGHSECQHTHECNECDGTGASDVVDDDLPLVACELCYGTGIKPDERKVSPCDDGVFKLRYWQLVASLPGVEVEHPIHGGVMRGLIFRFVGGYAAIMGLRFATNSIDLIRPMQKVSA